MGRNIPSKSQTVQFGKLENNSIVGYDVFIIKLPFDLPVESDFIVFLG